MALAYTPGLKVKPITVVQKTRKLPTAGEVLVKKGEIVSFDTVVARAEIAGEANLVNASFILGCDPEDVEAYMLRKEGDRVRANEIIAQRRSLFGMKSACVLAPANCTLERISKFTGQITIKGDCVPLEMDAYIPGKVVEVLPREGVVIETSAALVQGIFGIGGETHGELTDIAESCSDVLNPDKIGSACKGKILVGGSLVTCAALRKAVEMGVKGIIVGSIKDRDLADFLGYEIGVAITGYEKVGLTLVITEGFGGLNMSEKTFKLLKSLRGKCACINGATQIRAGVTRPEIIVPRELGESKLEGKTIFSKGMVPGMLVRIIRQPYFGAIGRIAGLPVELQRMESESQVRVVQIDMEDGRRVTVPRANVEIIEE